MKENVLNVRNLRTHFFTSKGTVKAVDDVTFKVNSGETMGLVGESGSGKTVTALSIMRLVPIPGRLIEGDIIFEGENLAKKSESDMRKIRGKKIAMSFQDPMTYLNPVIKVGDQIAESFMLHEKITKSEALKKAVSVMEDVGIPSPSVRALSYPHQLSGGMRQRVLIAIAISCNPNLLILDEPTTALDVITQSQILDSINDLKRKLDSSIILITHDLGIVAELCDKLTVMYAGNVLESGDTKTIFKKTAHPYTRALLESIPRLDYGKRRLKTIRGAIPDLLDPPTGCKFHPRCSYAKDVCSRKEPKLIEVKNGHFSSCPFSNDKIG